MARKAAKGRLAPSSQDVAAATNGNAVYDAMVEVLWESVEMAVYPALCQVCDKLTGTDEIVDHLDDVRAFIAAAFFELVTEEFDALIRCYGSDAKDHLPFIAATAMFHSGGGQLLVC